MGWITKLFPTLDPFVLAVKLAFGLAIVAAIFLAGCYVTREHYKAIITKMDAEWAKDNEAAAQAQVDYVTALDKFKHDAGVQHAQEQLVINDYRNRLADGVRIHIPASDCAAAQGAAARKNPDGGGGVFQQRVDEAFARFQSGVERLVSRCDQLNVDARQMNRALGY